MKALQIVPPLTALILFAIAPVLPAAETPTGFNLVRQLNEAFVSVAEKVSPCVVVITVVEKPSVKPSMPDDPLHRRFFEEFEGAPPESLRGQGSGVIIRTNGYIITNRHVVEDAERIDVRLKDGRRFRAEVRGVDPASDVAVIKIDAVNLPVASFADSARTRVGEFAIAIGAPFNLDYSVTFGHVSAKGRSNLLPVGVGGAGMDQDFIQTDANINPGNSGGPLVNIDGEVIGINTLVRGLSSGIGFAIPSNLAREIAEKLIADGRVIRPWLGIRIRALNDYSARDNSSGTIDRGIVVQEILPEGPASKSKLKRLDIITAIAGVPVGSPQELRNIVRNQKIGEPVALDVFRNGEALKLTVVPEEFTEPVVLARSVPAATAPTATSVQLGLTVREIVRKAVADESESRSASGLIVVEVAEESPAARGKIKAGDVIGSIGNTTIGTLKEFTEAVRGVDLEKGVIVSITSGDATRFEVLKE